MEVTLVCNNSTRDTSFITGRLYYSEKYDKIVLCTDPYGVNKDCFKGVLICAEGKRATHYTDGWIKDVFIPFVGKLELVEP